MLESLDFIKEDYKFVSLERDELLNEVSRRLANRQLVETHVSSLKFDNGLILNNKRYLLRESAFGTLLNVAGFSKSSTLHLKENEKLLNENLNELLVNHKEDPLMTVVIDGDGEEIRGFCVDASYYGEDLGILPVLEHNLQEVIVHGVIADSYCRLTMVDPNNKIVVEKDDEYAIGYDVYFSDCGLKYSFSTALTHLSDTSCISSSTYPGVRKHCSLKKVLDREVFLKKQESLMDADYAKHKDMMRTVLKESAKMEAKTLDDYAIFKRQAKRLFGESWKHSKLAVTLGETRGGEIIYNYNNKLNTYEFINEIISCSQDFSIQNPLANYKGEKLAGQIITQAAEAMGLVKEV